MPKSLQAAFFIAICALFVWQLSELSGLKLLLGDFRAFFCGGAMVLHGNNPYIAGPLLRCEQIPQPFGLHSVREADLPAPFPGYTLAIFSIFALMPYVVAASVWFCILISCTVIACIFLAQLCHRTIFSVFALLAVAFSISVIPYGELAPVVMAALSGAALAVRNRKYWAAAMGFAVVALLPHVALPVFVASFLFLPAMRWPILALVAVLAIVDVAIGGFALALSYVTHVLPNHAASEIGFVTQYSVTWMAQSLGASDRVALAAGDASYAIAAMGGVFLARVLTTKFKDPALLVVIPAALAVTGGSFVHYSEITLALPASLLLYSYARGRARSLAGTAVVLVALPWQAVVTQPALILPVVIGAIAICVWVLETTSTVALRSGLGAAVFCGACLIAAFYLGPQTAPHFSKAAFDTALAEASWAKHISEQTASGGIVWWIPKAPTWTGLVLLSVASLFMIRRRELAT